MDFATRDRYRHAVEGIARRSQLTEYEVARKAVQLAENHAREKPDRSRGARRLSTWSIVAARCWSDSPKCGSRRPSFSTSCGGGFRSRVTCRQSGLSHWLPRFFSCGGRSCSEAGWLAVVAAGRAGADQCLASWEWASPTGWRRNCSARNRCRGWISSREFRPNIARWWQCPPCSPAPPALSICWTDWKCGISPIATRCLHFALLTDFVDAAAEVDARRRGTRAAGV